MSTQEILFSTINKFITWGINVNKKKSPLYKRLISKNCKYLWQDFIVNLDKDIIKVIGNDVNIDVQYWNFIKNYINNIYQSDFTIENDMLVFVNAIVNPTFHTIVKDYCDLILCDDLTMHVLSKKKMRLLEEKYFVENPCKVGLKKVWLSKFITKRTNDVIRKINTIGFNRNKDKNKSKI